jgi:hypothetical protein
LVATVIGKKGVLSDERILLIGNLSISDTFLTNEALEFDIPLCDPENEEKGLVKVQVQYLGDVYSKKNFAARVAEKIQYESERMNTANIDEFTFMVSILTKLL